MQHFTTALLVGDLLARLHATFAISVLARFDQPVAQRLYFSLVRASGGGDWMAAIRTCGERLAEFQLPAPLHRIVRWPLSSPDSREEREAFITVAAALAELAAGLQHGSVQPVAKQTARCLVFDLLIQIRNKTVHGAYNSRFYDDYVHIVHGCVAWVSRQTPLWDAELLYVPKSETGRLLRGPAPTRSMPVESNFDRDSVAFAVAGETWDAGSLIHVQADNTYLANGSWRDSDTTAEFLCHALAAEQPGQGTLRLALPILARPPMPSVGQVVDGHYRILKVLGTGADAVVYLACDTHEGVEYVLKAFREPKEDFDQRRAEFEALQRINHPSVPRVLEVHGWEDPFHLRFEYTPGASLETKRSEFLGDPAAVASLGITLADALAAVHSVGYVHRDVAPDNILIPADPSVPVSLFDFDLVAPIGTTGPAGTSLYRPPESDTGVAWTEASDVYSLSVVLFELLTGYLPYETQEGELDRRVVPPSANETADFGDMSTVLRQAASLDPADRYANAVDFGEALESLSPPSARASGRSR